MRDARGKSLMWKWSSVHPLYWIEVDVDEADAEEDYDRNYKDALELCNSD